MLDFVFPPRCLGCGLVGQWICAPCRRGLPLVRPPFCTRCGHPTPHRALRCGKCEHYPPALRQVRSALLYEGAVRTAVHRLKYRGVRALAEPLGSVAAEAFARLGWRPDVLVPVPLHPHRLRDRGYNQAALLAAVIADAVDMRVDSECLSRVRFTASQVEAGPLEARRRNVEGAFGARDVSGRSVVLVDDVTTTGSTLSAAAVALMAAGAAEVRGFTLAREL